MTKRKGNMKAKTQKFKKGIASFYIVTFTTLILTIMTASFAVVIVSETSRTSNDDLSQSAYDAALAGVEDAKIAYGNYQRCKTIVAEDPHSTNNYCRATIKLIEEGEPDCDMVGKIAGRYADTTWQDNYTNDDDLYRKEDAVLISETTTTGDGNNMNQYYTCATIKVSLDDYHSTLSPEQQVKVIRGIFKDDGEAGRVQAIELSWYTNKEDLPYNFNNISGSKAIFPPASAGLSKPPVLEVQLVQTAVTFELKDLWSETEGDQTDRATLFLVPSNIGGSDTIEADKVAGTNDRKIQKTAFPISCNTGAADNFACSVKIKLPKPIGDGSRNADTFALMIALPYGEPETDFSVKFCKGDNCVAADAGGDGFITLNSLQIEIDSTGRANNLYRRVVTRLEPADAAFAYPHYALQLLDNSAALRKDMTVLCESGLYDALYNSTASSGRSDGCH